MTVTADTVLVNFANTSALQIGDLLKVGGQVDANNSFVATRIERKTTLSNWRLTGFLTSINAAASTAVIGTQIISFAGVAPKSCPSPLTPGLYVEVRAYADSAGNLFSTRIRDRGNIRPDRFRLAGPAANIFAPTSFVI